MMTGLGYLVLVAIVAGWAMCYRHPAFALAFVLILYPLKQLQMSYMGIFMAHSSWFNYLIFFGVCLAVLSSISRNPMSWKGYWNPLYGLLMFLYFFALLAVSYSPSSEYALERVRDGAPYWIMQVLLLPLAFVEVRDIERFCAPFVVCASIIILLFMSNPYTNYASGRLTLQIGFTGGSLDYRGNPLATAQMGGQLAIVAALMLPRRVGAMMQLVRLAGIFLGLGIAVAAGSRGQLLMALLVIGMFWPLARTVRNVKQFFINAAGLCILALTSFVALRFFISQDAGQGQRWSIAEQFRTLGTRAANAWRLIEAWLQEPMKWPFGLGTNAYSFISGEPHSYAHNIVIEMLGELGFLGLACIITLFILIYRYSQSLFAMNSAERVDRASTAVLLGLSTYGVLLAMKQGTFVGAPDSWFLAVVAAKLVAAQRIRALIPVEEEWGSYSDREPIHETVSR